MRVSSFSNVPFIPPIAPQAVPPQAPCAPPAPAAFLPFSAQAFDQARLRDVPVLLFICDAPPSFADAALNMQIFERTVPVWLYPGMRPDVELLCQRAGALFSGEGALPLCALMLEDARVFLAAPLPPAGFALDPSRLYVWLSQADRRFAQNRDAFIRQAAQTVRSFRAEPLRKPYSPGDAAHDLTRALLAVRDPINGGFGKLKQPLCPALRFLSRAAQRDRQAHAALDQTLDAMLASDLYDPLDGAFFRATLTEDWRAFVPEKPLAINALLALTLLLLATAAAKMALYIAAYGLTVKRVLASVFLVWMACVFVCVILRQFRTVALVRVAVFLGAVLFALLCVLPVGDGISTYNAARVQAGTLDPDVMEQELRPLV